MWFILIWLDVFFFFQEISSVATQHNFIQRHLLNNSYAHPDTCAQYHVVNRKRRDIDVK